jgi:hypothetical protein
MARGRRGSLALRRRALPSPPSCRFIPALSETGAKSAHRPARFRTCIAASEGFNFWSDRTTGLPEFIALTHWSGPHWRWWPGVHGPNARLEPYRDTGTDHGQTESGEEWRRVPASARSVFLGCLRSVPRHRRSAALDRRAVGHPRAHGSLPATQALQQEGAGLAASQRTTRGREGAPRGTMGHAGAGACAG